VPGLPRPARELKQNTSGSLGAGDVVELRTGDAREAAALARRTLDEGTFAGWSEVLIGGVAENRGGLPIVTGNAHHFPAQETITYG
jgi:predicted nucleic acid-binding protein